MSENDFLVPTCRSVQAQEELELVNSTIAHFEKKVAELERKVFGSKGWQRVAFEIQRTLLQQIAYQCDDPTMTACVAKLSADMRRVLCELATAEYAKAVPVVLEALEAEEIDEILERKIFGALEVCWWVRRFATFCEWTNVLATPDLTSQEFESVLLPKLEKLSKYSRGSAGDEIRGRVRSYPPSTQWWYFKIELPLTPSEQRRKDRLDREYCVVTPLN